MTMAAMGRPLPVLGAALLAAAAIVTGAMTLLPRLAMALAWLPAAIQTLFTLLLYGTLALVAWSGRRAAALAPDPAAAPIAPALGLGLALGIGGFALALAQAALSGSVERGAAGGGMALVLLGTIVVAGQSAAEELFFRGWLQPVLRRGWSGGVAVVATALAFSALHVAGGARSALTLLNLFGGGLLFGLLAIRTGGIAASIGAHAGWNWAEGILFGLDPNPGTGAFGAIRDLDLTGTAMWGGSPEGLNASIAMAVVLAALVLPFAVAPAAWRVSSRPVRG